MKKQHQDKSVAAGANGASSNGGITRRKFLRASMAGAGMLMAAPALARGAASAPATARAAAGAATSARPNFLLISTDQHGMDALSAYGCKHVHTPNIDRLVRGGTSFMQSYTTNPLCSPARSSWFTGRMPCETGVVGNNLAIRDGMPTLGQLLKDGGYDTLYCGKWHVPGAYSESIPNFRVMPAGIMGQGHLGDTAVSQACAGLLRERRMARPFAMVASILQPHDINAWINDLRRFPIDALPFGLREEQLPELPPNFEFDRNEPEHLRKLYRSKWTDLQWRYYLWSYYRHVEMADAEVGRILDALNDSPYADNTVVIFTSDHGEGRARHKNVMKNYLYDEAAKVPLVICRNGQVRADARDNDHLVSGVDLLPTICDYAGLAAPSKIVGRSLRPLLEGKAVAWRESLGAEVTVTGRMLRTANYKYVTYRGDPVEQLFDMKNDPWETKNLAPDSTLAATLADHRKLLAQWESQLDVAPPPATTRKATADDEG